MLDLKRGREGQYKLESVSSSTKTPVLGVLSEAHCELVLERAVDELESSAAGESACE